MSKTPTANRTAVHPLKDIPRIGLDIETKDMGIRSKTRPGVYRQDSRILGIGIVSDIHSAYYNVGHLKGGIDDASSFYDCLRSEALGFRGELVGANLLYDIEWLAARHDITFPHATLRDVQIAERLIDPAAKVGLDALGEKYVGEGKDKTLEDEAGEGWIERLEELDPELVGRYCIQDCRLALDVFAAQEPIIADLELQRVFDLESALLPVVVEMMCQGVRIDMDKLAEWGEGIPREIQSISDAIVDEHGEEFRLKTFSETAKVIKPLLLKLGVDLPLTPTGKPSASADVLKKLEHPVAKQIVRGRQLKHKLSNVYESINRNHADGRLHGVFHQVNIGRGGTRTGRFSCSHPNLQNVQVRGDADEWQARELYLPDEGCQWASLDYNQIEFRLLVHYSARLGLTGAEDAVRSYGEAGGDFHQMTVDLAGVDRRLAKAINFGTIYGAGPAGLSKFLGEGATEDEAREVRDTIYRALPFMREMRLVAESRGERAGYVRTIAGRMQRIHPDKPFVALNYLLQGSAADILKAGLVRAHREGLFSTLVLHSTVHDEVNVSVPPGAMDEVERLRNILATTTELLLPTPVDVGIGASWADAKAE